MTMGFKDHLRFWLLAGLAAAAFVWIFNDILLPFVAGTAIAYLLDPLVERLTNWKFPRALAVTTVLIFTMLLTVLTMLLIVPIIGHQIALLAERAPVYAEQAKNAYSSLQQSAPFGFSPERFDQVVSDMFKSIQGNGAAIAQRMVNQGLAILSMVSLLLIAPVVAFYLMLDWQKLVAALHKWLPRPYENTLLRLAYEIDNCLSGFVRGQMLVCGIQAIGYAAALSLAGLEYGIIIGLLAGALSFIPIVGAAIGLGLSVAVAFFQFWPDWPMIAAIATIFFAGQMLEANYLTPKLVGAQVGLHPVWIIFALLAFGSLFGFLGLLLAVPVTAAMGVLTRFALEQYLGSIYYTGQPRMLAPLPEGSADIAGNI
jgi:predicted PurR-regulated permease PerM